MTTWETPRLTIRPWSEDDAADMHVIFSDPEAMQFWNVPLSSSAEDMLPRIRHSCAASPEHHAAWAVVFRQTGPAMGFLNYHRREPQNRRLEIGYILAQSFWGQGLGREAVAVLLDHCFNALEVNRVEALIDPANHALIRLALALGFQQESGPMRQRLIMPDSRLADILMFGLLAHDWHQSASTGDQCGSTQSRPAVASRISRLDARPAGAV